VPLLQISRLFFDVHALDLRHPALMGALVAAARTSHHNFTPLGISHVAECIACMHVRDSQALMARLGTTLVKKIDEGAERLKPQVPLRFLCACATVSAPCGHP
jgi:hypothetical protein